MNSHPLRSVLLLTACVVGVLMVLCDVSHAAFPGRNGLLVVEPASGGGLVLINANGSDGHRICTQPGSCGSTASIFSGAQARQARISPDGRSLLYPDADNGFVSDLTGNCQGRCENADDGGFATDGTPVIAFSSNGSEVSYVSHNTIVNVGIDGYRDSTLTLPHAAGTAPITAAVWSGTGQLAVSTAGRIWIYANASWKLLGSGTDPSWAPSGHALAVVRKGVVWLVPVAGGRARRLVAGSAPVISPDGHEVAFLRSDHRVEVVDVGGGHPHQVGTLRGVSLDWQPIPVKPVSNCALLPGAALVADDGAAVVTLRIHAIPNSLGGGTDTTLIGCARADGESHLLLDTTADTFEDTTFESLGAPKLAGDFMAIAASGGDYKYDNGGVSVDDFDLATGMNDPFGPPSVLSAQCAPDVLSAATCGVSGVFLTADGSVAAEFTQPDQFCPTGATNPCPTIESIDEYGPAGSQVLDHVSFAPGAQTPYITSLTLAGDTLSWDDTGTIRTATMH